VRSDLTVGRRRRAVHLTSVHAATYEGCIDAISSIRSNDHAKYGNRMHSRGPGDVRAPIRSLESSCTSERDPAGRTAHHRSCSNVPGPDRGHQHHHQQRPWHVRESNVFKTLWRFLRPDPVYGRQLYERISWNRAAQCSRPGGQQQSGRQRHAHGEERASYKKGQESLGAVCLIRTIPNCRTSVRC
jgi:hypothetical protein